MVDVACFAAKILCGENRWQRIGNNHIYFEPDKFGGDLSVPLRPPFRLANFDNEILTVAPAEFAEPLYKLRSNLPLRGTRRRVQKSDGGNSS